MQRAVAGMLAQAGVPCQVSLERLMACGIGACLSCVVTTAVRTQAGLCRRTGLRCRGGAVGCVADTAEALDPLSLWGPRLPPACRGCRNGRSTTGPVRRYRGQVVGHEHGRRLESENRVTRACEPCDDRVGHLRIGEGVRAVHRPLAPWGDRDEGRLLRAVAGQRQPARGRDGQRHAQLHRSAEPRCRGVHRERPDLVVGECPPNAGHRERERTQRR